MSTVGGRRSRKPRRTPARSPTATFHSSSGQAAALDGHEKETRKGCPSGPVFCPGPPGLRNSRPHGHGPGRLWSMPCVSENEASPSKLRQRRTLASESETSVDLGRCAT